MLLIILLLMSTTGLSLTVYDCNHPTQKVQPIDLLQPQECPDPLKDYDDPIDTNVMVLQTDSSYPVKAHQCLAVISRQTTLCSFDSWTGVTEWPVWQQNIEITPQDCRKAVASGKIVIDGQHIEITPNTRTQHTYFSQGGIEKKGYYKNRCSADSFHRGGKHFNGHYEESHLTLTIATVTGLADLATSTVVFQNGLRARYKDQVIKDAFLGVLVWTHKDPQCNDSVSQIYYGQGELHRRRPSEGKSLKDSLLMIKNTKSEQYAGLVIKDKKITCGSVCHTTQIPGIMACLYKTWQQPVAQQSFKPHFKSQQADLQTEIAFLQLSTQLQFYERFTHFNKALCELGRSQLHNKLQALAGAENPYALLDYYGPGHTVMKSGLAAYVVKCTQIEATKASYPNCTTEIPVSVNNSIRFADPYTWVLQELPTVLPCSDITPVRWMLHGEWFCATPEVHLCAPPARLNISILDHLETPRLDLDTISAVGHGLFTQEQLDANRQFRIAQSSRTPIIQRVTNAATHNSITSASNELQFGLPFHPDEAGALIDIIGPQLLPGFAFFGRAYVYICGIFLLGAAVKLILGTGLRLFVVFTQKGCGRWLFVALWDTLFSIFYVPYHMMASPLKAAIQASDIEAGLSRRRRRASDSELHPLNDKPHPIFYPDIQQELQQLRNELNQIANHGAPNNDQEEPIYMRHRAGRTPPPI